MTVQSATACHDSSIPFSGARLRLVGGGRLWGRVLSRVATYLDAGPSRYGLSNSLRLVGGPPPLEISLNCFFMDRSLWVGVDANCGVVEKLPILANL